MKRRVRRQIRHREPLEVGRGTEELAEHGLGVAWLTVLSVGHDVSARHSAGVCLHSVRPLSVRERVNQGGITGLSRP